MPDTPAKLAALTQAAIEALPGDPGSRGWVAAFRATLARAHTAAYLAATAERLGVKPETLKGLSRAERADITRTVDAQFAYLAGFQQDIPGMSDAAIAARAQLYAGPVRATYSQARFPGLPFYPTQGSECQANCKCSWRDEGNGVFTWVMGDAEHCATCNQRAAGSPYRIGVA